MKEKGKKAYEAPSIKVFELKMGGVVCVSGGEYPGWDPENI